VTYRRYDDRHVREQAEADRLAAEAEAEELDRARDAMKRGTVVTRDLKSVGRTFLYTCIALAAVAALVVVVSVIRSPARGSSGATAEAPAAPDAPSFEAETFDGMVSKVRAVRVEWNGDTMVRPDALPELFTAIGKRFTYKPHRLCAAGLPRIVFTGEGSRELGHLDFCGNLGWSTAYLTLAHGDGREEGAVDIANTDAMAAFTAMGPRTTTADGEGLSVELALEASRVSSWAQLHAWVTVKNASTGSRRVMMQELAHQAIEVNDASGVLVPDSRPRSRYMREQVTVGAGDVLRFEVDPRTLETVPPGTYTLRLRGFRTDRGELPPSELVSVRIGT
jgi:hypothetical protein